MANRFLNGITVNDAYTLPSSDGTAGQAITTDGSGNLTFATVDSDAAQRIELTVKNVTSSTMSAGTVVRAFPSANPPSGNVLEVGLADYTSSSTMPAVGILAESIDAGNEGKCIAFGRVSGISTNLFSYGDEVYVGASGALTTNKPVGTKLIQKIGVVIKTHSTNGSIEVFGAGRSNDLPNLPSNHVWIGNGSGVPSATTLAATSITTTQITNWDTAYGWGDHSTQGYLTSFTETDPVFSASAASGITNTNILNWNTAYGWGDHSTAGYLTSFTETDTLNSVTGRGSSTSNSITVGGLHVDSTGAMEIPTGTEAQRPTAATGMIRFNTTAAEFEGYNGTEWTAIGGTGSASIDINNFTGDGTTVNFTLTSEIQEEDNTQVYIDGVYQSKSNYTTSGTTLTFSTAPPTGTSIEVVNFTSIAESQIDGTGTTNYVAKWTDADTLANSVIQDNGTTVTIGNDTIVNGDLTVDTNTLYVDSANNRVGIGTASPSWDVHIQRSSGAGYALGIYSSDGDELGGFYEDNGNNSEFYLLDSSATVKAVINSLGNSYLNGGNVGIGTSLPVSNLHIKDATTSSDVRIEDSTGNTTLYLQAQNGIGVIGTISSHALRFDTGDTERMRINSSGNVGIGTTNAFEKLEVAGNIFLSSANDYNYGGYIKPQFNSTNPLSFTYRNNSSSNYEWAGIYADAGGANNRLSLMSSGGNVGIGTTSPARPVHISSSDNAQLKIDSSDGNQASISFAQSTTDKYYVGVDLSANGSKNFFIYDADAGSNRLYIDSNGNVGIGTTNPLAKLYVDGPLNYNTGAWFGDGFVSNNSYHYIDAPVGISGRWNGTDNGAGVSFNSRNLANSNWLHGYISHGRDGHLRFGLNGAGTTSAVERMRLYQGGDLHVDGNVVAYSTTISDERLKDDVKTIDNALETIEKLRGVSYVWNSGKRKGKNDIGLIAQEVEKVVPEIVHENKMPFIDDEVYKTIDYEKLVGVLIESVKELSAEVKELKSKINM